jgi:hypothetical protein
MFKACVKQSELVWKMIVERAARHFRFFRDVAQRSGMKSGSREFIQRDEDQIVALLFGHFGRGPTCSPLDAVFVHIQPRCAAQAEKQVRAPLLNYTI